MPAPNGLPRQDRLTRAAELVAVRRSGTRIRVEYLDVRAVPSALAHARVGFVVPKYGHSSADRNRLKRRLRELVRTRLLPSLRPGAGTSGSAGSADDTSAGAPTGAKVGAGADAGTAGLAIPPVDVVVRALPTAYDASFSALAREIGRVYEGVRGRMTPSGR